MRSGTDRSGRFRRDALVNRALWVLWICAAALLWFFENNRATLTLLIGSAAIPALSVLDARSLSRRAALKLEAPELCARGEVFSAALRSSRTGLLSSLNVRARCFNALTGEASEQAAAIPPWAGRDPEGIAALDVTACRCGVLRLSAEVRACDLFGLWSSSPMRCEDSSVWVEPRLFAASVSLAPGASSAQDSERFVRLSSGGDPGESFDVREYVSGDPIRLIQWKLSAKTGKTMVREYASAVSEDILLVFRNSAAEGHAPVPEEAEALAEIFLSVLHALLREGYACRAAFLDRGRYAVSGISSEAELRDFETAFLSLSWEPGEDPLARFMFESACAHTALVCLNAPDACEVPERCEHFTVIAPGSCTRWSGQSFSATGVLARGLML